jgi:3',5'-cyclic AMP phosphodiesterase CpdA
MVALLELKLRHRASAYAQAAGSISAIVRDFGTLGAEHLIVSGDLTAYALPAEFEGAKAALGELAADPRRCTVIPGNHDRYTPGSRRDRRFENTFPELLHSDLPQYHVDGMWPLVRLLGDDVAVVGLQSAQAPAYPGFSFGFVGRRQLEALRAVVADPALEDRAVLVVVHHAPRAANGGLDKPHHGLWDQAELLRALPGPRFAVLHGHIHKRFHHPATADRPHIFGAGSSTQKGREGYWLIETNAGQIASGRMLTIGAT